MASNYVLLPVAPAVRATFNSNIRFSDASNNYILQGLKSVLNLTLPTESSPSKQAHLFTTLCFNFFFTDGTALTFLLLFERQLRNHIYVFLCRWCRSRWQVVTVVGLEFMQCQL